MGSSLLFQSCAPRRCAGQNQRCATASARTWGELRYLVAPRHIRCLQRSTALGSGLAILADRDHPLGEIIARADDARAGRGGMVVVSGESGAGKTSFVETFVERWVTDERVLWGACDPLPT